jgi:hypothetical protein
VLTLEKPGKRARGFLTFVDMIGLSKRIGASAGSLVRLAAGSTSDDDLATVLEWFAMNPDESLSPWRVPTGEKREQTKPATYLSIELLDVSGGSEGNRSSAQGADHGPSGAALDRLLLRLRGVLSGDSNFISTHTAAVEHVEAEDIQSGGPEPSPDIDPILGAFDRLWIVLKDRVPLAPRSELTRMIEIGAHVLTRRAAPLGRVQRFVAEWTELAVSHLVMEEPRDGLDETALSVICLAAALEGGVMQGRRRLLHFLGPSASMADVLLAADQHCWPSVKRLAAHAVGGETLAEVVRNICTTRCAFDDIVGIVAAARLEAPFPDIAVLANEPEIGVLRFRIAAGRLEQIRVVDGPVGSCPKHHRVLPSSEFYRLRSRGIATAECCGMILINRRP